MRGKKGTWKIEFWENYSQRHTQNGVCWLICVCRWLHMFALRMKITLKIIWLCLVSLSVSLFAFLCFKLDNFMIYKWREGKGYVVSSVFALELILIQANERFSDKKSTHRIGNALSLWVWFVNGICDHRHILYI